MQCKQDHLNTAGGARGEGWGGSASLSGTTTATLQPHRGNFHGNVPPVRAL